MNFRIQHNRLILKGVGAIQGRQALRIEIEVFHVTLQTMAHGLLTHIPSANLHWVDGILCQVDMQIRANQDGTMILAGKWMIDAVVFGIFNGFTDLQKRQPVVNAQGADGNSLHKVQKRDRFELLAFNLGMPKNVAPLGFKKPVAQSLRMHLGIACRLGERIHSGALVNSIQQGNHRTCSDKILMMSSRCNENLTNVRQMRQ